MNITLLLTFLDYKVRDELLRFQIEDNGKKVCAGFANVDRYSGGGKTYSPFIWSMATDVMNLNYKDDLFIILSGRAHDCYLYEQYGDSPATIYKLHDWGWKRISESVLD